MSQHASIVRAVNSPKRGYHQESAGGCYAHSGRATRGLSLPREGAWIATEIFFLPRKTEGELFTEWRDRPSSLTKTARGSLHPAHILAFQSECNPPAHTTAASRPPATANASPHPPPGREEQLDNTVGDVGGRHGADPAELGTHSEHFSPSPSMKRRTVRQH